MFYSCSTVFSTNFLDPIRAPHSSITHLSITQPFIDFLIAWRLYLFHRQLPLRLSSHQITSIHKKLCWLYLFVIVARSYSFLLRFMSEEWMGGQAVVVMFRLKFRRFAVTFGGCWCAMNLLYALASLLRNSNVKNIKTLHNCTTVLPLHCIHVRMKSIQHYYPVQKKWGF